MPIQHRRRRAFPRQRTTRETAPVTTSQETPPTPTKERRWRGLLVALFLLIAAASTFQAWVLLPPDRALPDPHWGMDLEISVPYPAVVDIADINLRRYAEDVWAMNVILAAPTADRSSEAPKVTITGADPLPCDRLSDFRRYGTSSLAQSCTDSRISTSVREEKATLTITSRWQVLVDPSPPDRPTKTRERRPTPEGRRVAEYTALIRIAPSEIGIEENASDFKMALPTITFLTDWPNAVLQARLGMSTDRDSILKWESLTSGVVPAGVNFWVWTVDPDVPHYGLIRGHDPSVDVADQRSLFLAGGLTGIAASAIFAAAHQIIEVIALRRRARLP